ncbi:MAG: hypothetical protein JJT94_05425 [Bernardetiaceae bacterium]|nr:hypothetical protein [Bernardetiaceae bacterium]
MKRFYMFIISFLLTTISMAQAQTEWFVLIAAATKDQSAGAAIQDGYNAAVQNVKTIANVLGYQLHLQTVEGNNFTKPNIENALNKMIADANNKNGVTRIATVITVSHGMNFAQTHTEFSYLVCNPGNNNVNNISELLSSEELLIKLKDSGAFEHTHVWVEACNSIPRGSGAAPQKSLKLRGARLSANPLHQLLTGANYSIMNAASYGQYAIAGAFGYALWEALEQVANGALSPDWNGAVFAKIKSEANSQVKKITHDKDFEQNPICYADKLPTNSQPVAQSNTAHSRSNNGANTTSTAVSIYDELKRLAPTAGQQNATAAQFNLKAGSSPKNTLTINPLQYKPTNAHKNTLKLQR